MFKNKIAILVAAALVSLSASSAFAAFADGDLIRVVYEKTTGTTEQVTDLGAISGLLTGTHTFAGTALTAGTASNLYVAYFAYTATSTASNFRETYAASNSANVPAMTGTLAANTLNSGYISFNNYYSTLTAGANGVYTGAQSNGNSYKTKLNASNGRLATALTGTSTIETSLASLVGASSGSVTEKLYHFTSAANAGAGIDTGVTIATNFDGSTTITAATPIPAAVYLMGSGLMGLVGLRRRNKA